jgi:nucleoside-diphosphate-sugar epimerase
MAFARLKDLWSRINHLEPNVTPESAALSCQIRQVNSSKAERELGYVQTPMPILLADTLAWMRQERMVGLS